MVPNLTFTRSTRSRAEGGDAGKDSSGSPIAPSNNNNNSASKSSQKKSLKFKIGSNSSLSEISNSQEDSQSKGGKRNDEKSSASHRSKRAKVQADDDKDQDQDETMNGTCACVLVLAVCVDSDRAGFLLGFNSIAESEKENPEDTSEQEQQQSWTDVALDVLDKVMVKDIFAPFNEPVDAIALGIPDYYEVITQPMDFGTVWDNLDKGSYTSPYFFIRDVQRIWANCKKFNEDDSEIVRICKRAEVGAQTRSERSNEALAIHVKRDVKVHLLRITRSNGIFYLSIYKEIPESSN